MKRALVHGDSPNLKQINDMLIEMIYSLRNSQGVTLSTLSFVLGASINIVDKASWASEGDRDVCVNEDEEEREGDREREKERREIRGKEKGGHQVNNGWMRRRR